MRIVNMVRIFSYLTVLVTRFRSLRDNMSLRRTIRLVRHS
jgi:hypothetical protein